MAAKEEKIKSYPNNEVLKSGYEEVDLQNKNNFLTLDLIKKFFKDLEFPENFINEYSILFFNGKIHLNSNENSKFFIMSYFSREQEKKIKLDHSVKFISLNEFIELLTLSKFFEKFPIVILRTSILIASIEEDSPIKISDIEKIMKNVLNLNNDPNIIFDEWEKNSGIISEEDNNILKILEYRNDLNLKKVEIENINSKVNSNDSVNYDEIDKENIQAFKRFLLEKKKRKTLLNFTSSNFNNKNDIDYNFNNFLNEKFLIENYNKKIDDSYINPDFHSDITTKKTSSSRYISRKLEIQTKHKKTKNYIFDNNYHSYSDSQNKSESPEIKSKTNTNYQDKLEEDKKYKYKHFIAGALSGLISRIITGPLERLKILYQVNYAGKGLKPPNIFVGLKEVYLNDGFLGLFRGNLVNLIKCTPDSAIKLYVFEKSKHFFSVKEKENKMKIISQKPTIKLLFSGGLSGICSTILLFPLEVIKTRISASPNSTYNGIRDTAVKLYSEGGLRIFYRGIQASLSSAVPNCGLNLTAYETLKKIFSGSTSIDNAKLLTTPMLMLIGGLSAMFSSTILYPLQTIQSRMIMGNLYIKKSYQNIFFTDLIKQNKKMGLISLAKHTLKTEGFKGFYKGYCPGITKIIIGNALGFSLYENIKNVIDLI